MKARHSKYLNAAINFASILWVKMCGFYNVKKSIWLQLRESYP